MKWLIPLVFFLLIASVVSAEEESIHEEWHSYHDFFTIGDDVYEMTTNWLDNGGTLVTKTLLKHNSKSFILSASAEEKDGESFIAKPDCIRDEPYRYCLVNITLDPDKGARTDDYGTYRFGVLLQIWEEGPDVNLADIRLTKEVSKSTLSPGQEDLITVSIENVGEEAATNIMINESVGKGLSIRRFDDFDIKVGNTLHIALPSLGAGQAKTYTYLLDATDYVNETVLTTNVTYDDPSPAIVSESTVLKIPWPYTLKQSFVSSAVEIQDANRLDVIVVNEDALAPIDAVLSLTLPPKVRVTKTSNLHVVGGHLVGTHHLEPGKEIMLSASFVSPFTGTFDLPLHLTTIMGDRELSESEDLSWDVTGGKITSVIALSKDSARSGEPLKVNVYVKNEDEDITFYDVMGVMESSLATQEFSVEQLRPGTSERPLSIDLHLPTVTNATPFSFVINGSGKSISGEVFTFSTRKEITVLPANQSLLLKRVVDVEEIVKGEPITVALTVENLASSQINSLIVRENLTQDADVIFGDTEVILHLYGDEERQALIYQFRLPPDYAGESYTLHGFVINAGQVIVSDELVLPVKDALVITNASAPVDNVSASDDMHASDASGGSSSTADDGSIEGHESFFASFINSLVTFFSKIF